MIDGRQVTDAHMHVPRLSTVTPAWLDWAQQYGKDSPWRTVFDDEGDPVPARLDALLAAEGVDKALLFAEYSPLSTGIQPIEDLLPIIEHNPDRFHLVANVNPEVHSRPAVEAARQLALGAVAVKVHPVHGAFRPDTSQMYDVYDLCAQRNVPVIVHTGPSIFPGSVAEAGDPKLLDKVTADFPDVRFVLAHGGRGRWYDDAATMALTRQNVWLDIAGLPPKRLPQYYAAFDLGELAQTWIFGTDWPGVPGIAVNARAVAALGLPDDILRGVLSVNAQRVYLRGLAPLGDTASPAATAISLALPPGTSAVGRQQPLQQHDLGVVEFPGKRQPPDMVPGESDGLLRRPQLLPEPDVLLGEPAVLGPRASQLVLEVGDGFP
jgi:uncharacterized protein